MTENIIKKTPSLKRALQLFPVEIWNEIISNTDIYTLFALRQTCSTLHRITKTPLLEQLIQTGPLYDVYLAADLVSVLPEVIYRMPKYIDTVIKQQLGEEPLKWTDNVYEWENYDEKVENYLMIEDFRREVGRKGKAKSRIHLDWTKRFNEEKRILRRELAKCYCVAGKFFPFSRDENREWKKRRSEQGKSNDLWNENEKSNVSKSSSKLRSSKKQSNSLLKNTTNRKQPQMQSVKKQISDDSWNFSHEIRNTPKPRPNLGKGLEEFHKQILTSFISPDYFFSPEDLNTARRNKSFCEDEYSDDNRPPVLSTSMMVLALRRFSKSQGKRVLKFPPELTAYQRKVLHHQAVNHGLKSLSFGEGGGRFLVVLKGDVEIFN
ncbi:1065_t:CDS:2 [Ambispora gerdemannii]|uniref:1065_t:CDS:1 n=1 Tax=Ambispora gerdemannii TaxID=144530 RepID=A0A9N8YQU2_9GLOM|nr:1065_t:CDS:2 [Ambispora gerdemannii]